MTEEKREIRSRQSITRINTHMPDKGTTDT